MELKTKALSPIYTNSGSSDFVMSDQFCQAVHLILPGSPTNFEIVIFLSLCLILCNVMSVSQIAYKNGRMAWQNWSDSKKSDWFWLFHVNDPLGCNSLIDTKVLWRFQSVERRVGTTQRLFTVGVIRRSSCPERPDVRREIRRPYNTSEAGIGKVFFYVGQRTLSTSLPGIEEGRRLDWVRLGL